MKNYYHIFLFVAFISTSVRAQEDILLKDYDPVSIYNTPSTKISKAKFPAVDFHSHPYPKSEREISEWVKTMDRTGVAKSIILTYQTGKSFDSRSWKDVIRWEQRALVNWATKVLVFFTPSQHRQKACMRMTRG